MSPEQKMYKEAAGHDRKLTRGKEIGKGTEADTKKTLHEKNSHGAGNSDLKLQKSSLVKTIKPKEEGEDLKITEDNVLADDKVDKASDAGTYTIEADENNDDETSARDRIDEVFGVDVDSFCEVPSIDPRRMASPGGYDNVRDDGEDKDGGKTPQHSSHNFPGADREEAGDDDTDVDDCDDEGGDDDDDDDEDLVLGDDDNDDVEDVEVSLSTCRGCR